MKGYGRQKNYLDQYAGSEYSLAFLPKVEIDLWVDDARVEEIVRKIVEVARTGRMGDGKIFILPMRRKHAAVIEIYSRLALANLQSATIRPISLESQPSADEYTSILPAPISRHRATAMRNLRYTPRRFERLETRHTLAGNVTVQLVNGDLIVTGDAADNEIQLSSFGHPMEVTGRNDDSGNPTSINGVPNGTFDAAGLTGNTVIRMLDGETL